jgi:biotin carboxylase
VPARPRLLLLLPTTTYRTDAFVSAATRAGVDLTVASELPSTFSEANPTGLLTLPLHDMEASAAEVERFAKNTPVTAVVGVDDDTALVAGAIATRLDLPTNPVAALEAARNKHLQRWIMRQAGVPVPRFSVHSIDDPVAPIAESAPYPCVVKPIVLSASRGVIRADDPSSFRAAHARLASILAEPDVCEMGRPARQYLVEEFVPGPEYALEGYLGGKPGGIRALPFHVLALFDKPDPLDGPYFEETIYVTPSRASDRVQRELSTCDLAAAEAVGLVNGPIHVDLRYSGDRAWLIELAARPIGGKCSRALRFGVGGELSLEDLIVRRAVGRMTSVPTREDAASGVMMIPTPRAGTLAGVEGVEAASTVPGVTEVVITAHRGQRLVPLPEGSRYLGFIFARGSEPAMVEAALRSAHSELTVDIVDLPD